MTIAMKNAGLSVPLNKRIWLWLKDHPGKAATELEVALGERRSGYVSSALNDLFQRGMVTCVKTRGSAYRHSNKGRTFVNLYTAVGTEYELLPKRKTPPAAPAKHFADTPVPAPEKVVGKSEINIENMTLTDARALYMRLKEFFG